MRSDLAALSVAELSVLIASRDVSPVDVVSSALAAVQRHDEKLKAYIDVYGDDALDSAKRAESEIAAGHYRGPLHGIPMAIKDNIYIANRRTTMGSKIHANFVPSSDAGVISRLTSAGAVFLGKANMHEYALGGTTDNPHWGTCRNPWDLSKTPGGSSGGSAAAIASNMAVAALGSDTSGSIRIPAAICGVVGLKPTYGRVSRFGVFPEAWTLDHVGPITRTVRDAALVLDAISGHDPRDPGSLELPPTLTAKSLRDSCEGLVIGVEEDFYFADVDDAVAQSVWNSIDTLRHRGATIQAVSISGLGHTEFALTVIDTSETTTPTSGTVLKTSGTTCGCFWSAANCLRPSTTCRRSRFGDSSGGRCIARSPTSTCWWLPLWAAAHRRSARPQHSSTGNRSTRSTA